MVSDCIRRLTRVAALYKSTDTLEQDKLAVQCGWHTTALGTLGSCRHGWSHLHQLTEKQRQQNDLLSFMIQ